MKKYSRPKNLKSKIYSKADLHLHTTFSDGENDPQEMVDEALKKGFSVVAIADHNRIKGAWVARKYALKHKLPIEIIIAEEIYTKQGEIIALFIKKWIKPHQDIEETCQEIKKQGGLVVATHPASIIGGVGLSYQEIRRLVKKNLLDAFEHHNGGDLVRFDRHLTKYKVKLPDLARLAGSDAHQKEDVGLCYTTFPGKSTNDLKKAIEKNLTHPHQKKTYLTLSHWFNYFSRGFIRILSKKKHYPHQTPKSFKIRSMLNQTKQKYWQV